MTKNWTTRILFILAVVLVVVGIWLGVRPRLNAVIDGDARDWIGIAIGLVLVAVGGVLAARGDKVRRGPSSRD